MPLLMSRSAAPRPRRSALARFATAALVALGMIAATSSPASALTPTPVFPGALGTVPFNVSGTYTPLPLLCGPDLDIFWYAPGTGADSIWKGVAGRRVSFSSIPQRISGSYTPLVGSFTPDPGAGGSTDSTLDIFWYAPGATADSLWKGDGNGHFVPQNYSVGGAYKPVVGFFDGYGVQDIFWYSANGADSVWLADPDTQKFTAHGASIGAGYTPITGEFTIPDEPIYWWSATGADHFWIPQGEPGTWDYSELSNNTDMGGGYKPVTLDFDGDGHNDILWLGNGTTHTKIWWGPG